MLIMVMKEAILDTLSPAAHNFPHYNVDVSDINEALDHGIANCAVRAYANGLLLREAYPSERPFGVQFGFDKTHGDELIGENGKYIKNGHAVVNLWLPDQDFLVVESFTNSEVTVAFPNEDHDEMIWMNLDAGYLTYLWLAGLGEVEVNPDEILNVMQKKSAQLVYS